MLNLTGMKRMCPDIPHNVKGKHIVNTAQVSGNAWVLGDAQVLGDARVSGDEWLVSPTQIQGSRHFVTHSKQNHITIGCYTFTIKEWKTNYKKIATENNYTDEQIEEYKSYIDLIDEADKRMIKLYWG